MSHNIASQYEFDILVFTSLLDKKLTLHLPNIAKWPCYTVLDIIININDKCLYLTSNIVC